MKLIQWLKHLGEGVCEIECEQCGRPFYHDTKCDHNKGSVVCPMCGQVEALKDLPGLYFVKIAYKTGYGGSNWQCGSCGCEFCFHSGETEEIVECPNCHARKTKNE